MAAGEANACISAPTCANLQGAPAKTAGLLVYDADDQVLWGVWRAHLAGSQAICTLVTEAALECREADVLQPHQAVHLKVGLSIIILAFEAEAVVADFMLHARAHSME